MKVF
jgi:hypothetical protein